MSWEKKKKASMPFQSKAQARFMFAKHPAIAKRWEDMTPSIKALPQHVKKKKPMAVLTTAQRKRLPKNSFGLPGKRTKKNKAGRGAYPMPDKAHARAAKSYAARFATPSQRAQIDAKANRILGKSQNAFDHARSYLKRVKGR